MRYPITWKEEVMTTLPYYHELRIPELGLPFFLSSLQNLMSHVQSVDEVGE
jgi:hypothetical protein